MRMCWDDVWTGLGQSSSIPSTEYNCPFQVLAMVWILYETSTIRNTMILFDEAEDRSESGNKR